MELNQNPFGGNRVFFPPFGLKDGLKDGRTEKQTDGLTNMTKLTVAFRNRNISLLNYPARQHSLKGLST
jgi:hypothetical protein